jgi:rhodanese-related sulfurtransferase
MRCLLIFRRFRLLAENRLAEIEQIRRRFFSEGEDVNPVDRKTLLERVEQKKAIVIDVQPPNEYRTAHIAGALPIPLEQLKQRLSELPRNKKVVAYCRGPFCVLAQEAVEVLRTKTLSPNSSCQPTGSKRPLETSHISEERTLSPALIIDGTTRRRDAGPIQLMTAVARELGSLLCQAEKVGTPINRIYNHRADG